MTIEETLEAMLETYLDREDPVRIAERAKDRKKSSEPLVPGRVQSADPRFISAETRHQMTLRDKDQCTHCDAQGRRCSERKWLHFHHIKPLSHGGQTTLENLTTLCSGHHRLQHHLVARGAAT